MKANSLRSEELRQEIPKVPWQIWVTVALLGLEGIGNLLNLNPGKPIQLLWLASKTIMISGLLLRWRIVYVLTLFLVGLHVVYFAFSTPIAAALNAVLLVLMAWKVRFYFHKLPAEQTRCGVFAPVRWTIASMMTLLGIAVALTAGFSVLNQGIEGIVINSQTGEPVQGANVLIWSGNPDRSSGYIVAHQIGRSGMDGHFRISIPRKILRSNAPLSIEAHAVGYLFCFVSLARRDNRNVLPDNLKLRLTPEPDQRHSGMAER